MSREVDVTLDAVIGSAGRNAQLEAADRARQSAATPAQPLPEGRHSAFDAVVFDFDGLLMDTESTLVDGWRAEWAFHGLELDLENGFWPGHGGDMTEHRLDRLGALVGPTFDRAASHARFVANRARMHRSMDLCPGIGGWLADAAALGITLAVASSSPLTWVREHLSRVGAFAMFDVVATGDEVPAHKPDPAIYHVALDRLRVDPHRAVAVEDTPHGVAAAVAAGLATVAVPNPFVDIQEFDSADVVLSSAADQPLADVVARLSDRG